MCSVARIVLYMVASYVSWFGYNIIFKAYNFCFTLKLLFKFYICSYMLSYLMISSKF